MKTVAITGITGTQGVSAARHFLKRGWKVRGLTRNVQGGAARALIDRGVELIEGNMDDPASLDHLLSGADGAYGVTDFFRNGLEKEVLQGKALADAVSRSEVKHFVFLSLALCDQQSGVPYLEAKAAIERHIRAIDLPATIIRPAMFMEDLIEKKYGPPFWWGTARRTIGTHKPLRWIAADDVGALVATIFAEPDRFIGQSFAVAGDFKSFAEARAIFKRVTGKRPLGLILPLWVCRRTPIRDVAPLWPYLARIPIDSDLVHTRSMLPEVQSMEAWLKNRVGATTAGLSPLRRAGNC
jgi:uncharacterized protein YbjT (DUF2867 family)